MIPTYAVTVTTDGNGTATADPTEAKAGEPVTVTVMPDEGYVFDTATGVEEWTYDAENGVITFMMPAQAVELSISFKEKPAAEEHTIKTLVTGEGTVNIPAKAAAGDFVTVTATPAAGYTLRALKVNGLDVTADYMQHNSYTFTMPDYMITVEAVFDAVAEGKHYIHLFVYGLGTAYADKTTAAKDDTVTITTEASIGYVFDRIEVNRVSQGAGVKTFTMPDEDVTVNVVFERKAYKITLNSGVQGTMNAIPRTNEAYADTTVRIIVNADEDYAVDSLTVKNDTTNAAVEARLVEQDVQTSIYQFTMPASPVTVTATYRKLPTNGYYLIGTHGWATDPKDNILHIDGNEKFVDDLSVDGQMMLTIDLEVGQTFKVVHVTDGAIDSDGWFPRGGNYTVDSAHAGTCVIYFRPDRGGNSDWWEQDEDRCFYVKRLQNEYYLAAADSTERVRTDDHLFINKEFDAEELVPGQDKSIRELYNVHYEHMVLTWLNSGDKIKVVRVRDDGKDWLPGGIDNAYPQYINSDSTQAKNHNGTTNGNGVYGKFDGMVFVFFEEELVNFSGVNCTGSVTGNQNRIDWTNNVFDVQKAYKADAAEKAETNPLNAESLTYNLEHGSITLSTGTAFIREGRSDAANIPTDTSNIIYELGLNQKVYCSIIPETGYALSLTPYITYGSSTVNMTKDAESGRWYFTMPSADVVIHAPMYRVFRTQSVLLSGQIGVNFFVDLSAYTDTEKQNMKMTFKIGNGETLQEDAFDPEHLNVTGKFHGFTCFLNAIQMADDITATLCLNEEPISVKHYSLQEYVLYFDRADSSQWDNTDALRVIRAMIDFGYYAQEYFFTDSAIASKYAEVERHYTTQFDYPAIKTMTASHSLSREENKNIAGSDIENVTLQLDLESATTLIVNLYMKSGSTAQPEIKVGGQTLSVGGEVVNGSWTWTLAAKDGGGYQLRIKGISPHNLDKQFVISGTANGTFTITASAFSYIDSALGNNTMENVEKAKLMAAAMYAFHEAEVAYRTSSGQN